MAQAYRSLREFLDHSPGKAPACPMCGAVMSLRDEPGDEPSERATFVCPDCDHTEAYSPVQLRSTLRLRKVGATWTGI